MELSRSSMCMSGTCYSGELYYRVIMYQACYSTDYPKYEYLEVAYLRLFGFTTKFPPNSFLRVIRLPYILGAQGVKVSPLGLQTYYLNPIFSFMLHPIFSYAWYLPVQIFLASTSSDNKTNAFCLDGMGTFFSV